MSAGAVAPATRLHPCHVEQPGESGWTSDPQMEKPLGDKVCCPILRTQRESFRIFR